ncbi:hypothetical protein ACHAWF_006495 [Thalassiosira exigua]
MNQPQSPLYLDLTVARLLCQREWALLETLLTSTSRFSILIDDPSLPHSVGADIVVHFAVRFQAPLRVVSQLSRMYPQSLSSTDVTGRYPIHVAAKWSSTPDVIAYLIKTNPAAVGIPDSTGKTPMHYVGEWYLKHFNNAMYSRDDSMLQVVRLLKNAAPQSVNLEDKEGTNAIEYALESDADIKVIKAMQRACRDDWRERSKSNNMMDDDDDIGDSQKSQPGRRRHEDLVKDMVAVSLKLQRQCSKRGPIGEKILDNRGICVHHPGTSTTCNALAARTA